MDDLATDLRTHIFTTYANAAFTSRYRPSHWVMNLEWLLELRKLDDSTGPVYQPGQKVTATEMLLGLPIEVRDDGGPPHLEPDVPG